MSEVTVWKGFRENLVSIMGTVMNDPQYVQAEDGEWAFLTIRTIYLSVSQGGQYNEIHVDVPVVVNAPHILKVVRNNIKAGRELYIKGYYRNWDSDGAQQHGIFATFTQLGRTPRDAGSTYAPQTPSLP